ncbi:MAG: transporter [Acidobacteriota bacterium]|nr:MAG: transporter [Acidobacteriota bacterium]
MKEVIFGSFLTAFFGLTTLTASAQQRPLITEDIDIVKPGSVRFELGIDFQTDRNFPLSGLNGDLTRLGVVAVTIGLAPNVEVETGGVLQNYLSINRQYQPSAIPLQLSQATNSSHDWGDFYVATKIKLRRETKRGPALGYRFGAEMPNSNQARGIGVNQTNFFATVIASKHFGRFHVFGNLGLGILTAPVDPFTQNDVLLYGLAATWTVNDRLTMVGEVNGRYSTRNNTPLGTESDGAARIGARIRAAGLMWDIAGIRGLHRDSTRGGITFGVTYEAKLLEPVK